MSFLYAQKSGEIFQDDVLLATGYAGRYTGKNNPAMQNVEDIGPIPCGIYRIDDSYTHPKLGVLTMDLTPDAANEMFGRSLFRIHGDSAENPGMASEGCIVLPHDARVEISKIAQTGDRLLEVVAERPAA